MTLTSSIELEALEGVLEVIESSTLDPAEKIEQIEGIVLTAICEKERQDYLFGQYLLSLGGTC